MSEGLLSWGQGVSSEGDQRSFQSSRSGGKETDAHTGEQRTMDQENAAQPSTSAGEGFEQGEWSERTGNTSGEGGSFECNICLELAQDPVVTLCGHLFCWPCLYRWLRLHSQCKECPVCKAGVNEKNVIPLYGRGTSGQDPRTKPVSGPEIPRRPAGQRPESQRAPQMGPFGFMAGPSAQFGNFTLSAGFGLFPSLLGLQWQAYTGDPMPAGFAPEDGTGVAPVPRAALTPEQQQQAFLSRLLVMLGSFVLLCLLFF
eukprot:TRINITY_DN16297_c0_g1_i1.p1 TRINITY_DN16297_c0_g1~~TRINITY_DN16297_c0_g1_i1.p1  ORF type:complete len:257 (+),score=16.27 TRINITY_DN16297_c0_g1_i1:170-940(+)